MPHLYDVGGEEWNAYIIWFGVYVPRVWVFYVICILIFFWGAVFFFSCAFSFGVSTLYIGGFFLSLEEYMES